MMAMTDILKMAICILCSHHIKLFILKACDSVNNQSNDNGPKLKLKEIHGQYIMNSQIHHGNLKFTSAHMNSVLVEIWRSFQISSSFFIINASNKTKLVPLNPPDEDTNTKFYLAASQTSKIKIGIN